MSRILKNKEFIACLITFSSAVGIIFTNLWPLSILFLAVTMVIIINKLAKRFLYKNIDILHNRTEIREIDTLVIGDNCDLVNISINKERTLFYQSADRSFTASYQIFMHIESLLNEGGRLIFICNTRIDSEKISIFDISYLHPITKKELGLESLEQMQRFPLIYEPIKSLKNILNYRENGFKITECNNELNKFCNERNIELIYLEK